LASKFTLPKSPQDGCQPPAQTRYLPLGISKNTHMWPLCNEKGGSTDQAYKFLPYLYNTLRVTAEILTSNKSSYEIINIAARLHIFFISTELRFEPCTEERRNLDYNFKDGYASTTKLMQATQIFNYYYLKYHKQSWFRKHACKKLS